MKIMFALRPIVVTAALWLLPQLCAATEMDMEMEEEGAVSTAERSEKKEAFTPKECETVVKKVQETGKFTEESIVPVCNDVMGRSSGCDFFAEALSLASSHSDFQGKTFCEDMDRAQFCSEIMDKLLESTSVSDLAFGECERAKPQKSLEYCRRIQSMLGQSVKQEDLDTMRACYMMEAYTNQTGGPKALAEATAEANPQNARIITGANKEIENIGKGSGPGHPPPTTTPSNIGQAPLVLQPVPLENFGEGRGNMSKPKNILVEPQPAGAAPAAADAAGAPAAGAPAPAGPILAKPIPAPEKSQLQTSAIRVVVQPPVAHPAPVTVAVASSQPHPSATAVKVAAPVILEVHVDAKQNNNKDQPLVAQAVMQNGTLVMTGSAFGKIVVDKSRIEEALQKQAAAPRQAPPSKTIVAPKPVAAPTTAAVEKPVSAPKQDASPKAAPVPATKAKTGLVVVEPSRVVAAAAPKPTVAVAPPVTKTAPATVPAAVSAVKSAQAAPQTKVKPAAAAAPQPPVSTPIFVVVMPTPAPAVTQPVVQAVATKVQSAPQVAAAPPALPPPATKPVAKPAQVAVAPVRPVVQPVAPQQSAQPVIVVVQPQPVAKAQPAPAAQPAVQPVAVRPVGQVALEPVAQAPVPQPAAKVVAVAQVAAAVAPVTAPVAPAQVVAAPSKAAGTVAQVTAPVAPAQVVAAPSKAAAVVVPKQQATPVQVAAAPKPMAKAPTAVVPATAVVSPKQQAAPALVAASPKAVEKAPPAKQAVVSKHNAGLAQAALKHGKVDMKEKEKKVEKKNDYSGFLSKFIAFVEEDSTDSSTG